MKKSKEQLEREEFIRGIEIGLQQIKEGKMYSQEAVTRKLNHSLHPGKKLPHFESIYDEIKFWESKKSESYIKKKISKK